MSPRNSFELGRDGFLVPEGLHDGSLARSAWNT